MSIDAIAGAASALRLGATELPSLPSLPQAAPVDGGGFEAQLTGAIDHLNGLHKTADTLAIQAATGDLTDVHDYTIAAAEAELATQLTVAVRDKAVEAFNEIMRMQV